MKLLPKAAFYLLVVAIPITTGSVFWLKGYIHREVIHEIDELLLNDLRQVEYKLRQHLPASSALLTWDPNVSIVLTEKPGPQKIMFRDAVAVAVDDLEKEIIPVRLIRSNYRVKNQYYLITIRQSYLEFGAIANVLPIVVIGCFLVVIGYLLVADVLIARRIGIAIV